jgi:hypothetical protein
MMLGRYGEDLTALHQLTSWETDIYSAAQEILYFYGHRIFIGVFTGFQGTLY